MQQTSMMDDAQVVYTHYRSYHKRIPEQLPPSVRPRIEARLREGWTAHQLCLAIDGCHRSAWHMGANPQGRTYNSLETILRNSDRVNMFVARTEQDGSSSAVNDTTAATMAAIMDEVGHE